MASAFAVLNETVPAPGWALVGTTAVFAGAVSATSFALMTTGTRLLLNRVNVLGTLFHEGGHALVSILTGGGVFRIEITGAESGQTEHWNPSPFAGVLATAAGYAMPPLAGLGAAALLHRGLVPAVLALTAVAMLFILLFTRDVFTGAAVVAVGAVVFCALRWAPDWLKNGIAYAEAWLLLTSELGGLGALVANRFRGVVGDDASSLAERTGIPGFVWILGWFVVIGWAVWHAVPMLWP
ncbi:M50 family metallopeptidase [Amycolatopsis sp. SID8362]|uniref:M50 family metallopeptidase n=1 Tax=Amycolatopsis sp. SID8362 TaxID=2690346 RepID=UPI00136C8170|nr:M50 family metallopeptidase [Amycolatopsis sp. SID8362]NBH09105.1 M50 family peptidase [Amycolatopsis sp. SID8362]NED45797.1 M50 family metallopeptidase [Amycolatopsis sp. SID8362]